MYSEELVKKYTEKRDNYRENDAQILEPLKRIGLAGKTVLDLGCGDGRHAEEILDMGAAHVEGIDISSDMIRLAQARRKPDLNFVVADGSALPFDTALFDIVFSNFVMHYFPDLRKTFIEIGRVLKPGGYFVGAFNRGKVQRGHEDLFNTYMPIRLGPREDGIIVQNLIKSEEEISSSLAQAHLSLIEEKILNHPNAVIDDSYASKDKVTKEAILIIARKI